jgi:hypothetical protein
MDFSSADAKLLNNHSSPHKTHSPRLVEEYSLASLFAFAEAQAVKLNLNKNRNVII